MEDDNHWIDASRGITYVDWYFIMHTHQQQYGLYGKGFALEMEAQRDWCRTDRGELLALQTHETDEFGGHDC